MTSVTPDIMHKTSTLEEVKLW